MIHDAHVEVTCDNKNCKSHVFIQLEYVYSGVGASNGRYDDDERKVEKKLVDEHSWIVVKGKHYCCEDCDCS